MKFGMGFEKLDRVQIDEVQNISGMELVRARKELNYLLIKPETNITSEECDNFWANEFMNAAKNNQ